MKLVNIWQETRETLGFGIKELRWAYLRHKRRAGAEDAKVQERNLREGYTELGNVFPPRKFLPYILAYSIPVLGCMALRTIDCVKYDKFMHQMQNTNWGFLELLLK